MSFVEGNLQVGIELAPGTLDRLKSQLAQIEKGATLKVNVDPRSIDQGSNAINNLNRNITATSNNISNRLGGAIKSVGTTVGTLAAVGGASLVALGTKAIFAGKEFNILQQQVRAGLTAILGTSKAAEGLLKQVNLLNDTSPFPRSSFLAATQQLVGFGVSASKVVPILDAVQQAVAGIGGDSNDIARFTRAFAQIQSQGRLTGDVLFTLGEKGIDAAEIIGKQMGKSGQAIKDEVTAGTLGAEKAIDALTAGLKTKFDGATENVAKSFAGASQRVQARLRDIGAEITRAFINPLGGGAAVDALNNVAKGLANIRDNVIKPMLPLFQQLGNLLIDASQLFLKFTASLKAEQFQKVLTIFQTLAPLITLFGTGLVKNLTQGIPVINKITGALSGPLLAITVLIATVPELREQFLKLVQALTPVAAALLPALQDAFNILKGVFAALVPLIKIFVSAISGIAAVVTPIVSALQKMGLLAPIIALLILRFGVLKVTGSDAFKSITNAVTGFTSKLKGVVSTSTQVTGAINNTGNAISGVGLETTKVAGGFTSLKAAAGSLGSSIVQSIDPVSLALAGVAFIITDVINQFQNAKNKALELSGAVTKGLDFGKLEDQKLGLEAINQEIANLTKTANKGFSFGDALFGDDSITKQQAAKSAAKDAIKDLQNQAKAIETVKEKQQSLGAGVLQQIEGNDELSKQFTNITDVIKFATENGIDFNSLRFDQIIGATSDIVKKMKELPPVIDEAGKKFEALKVQVDLLAKVSQASDKLKASEKALADLRKTTSQQLQDNVTKAESNLAEVRRNQGAVNDAVTRSELGLAQARRQTGVLATKLNDLERDRARLLADTGAEARELADANADLARTDQELLDISQRREAIERDQADLEEEKAGKIAAAGRSVERSQIALNTAKREELELKKELNKEDEVSLDLSGLSVDQIKSTLAGARAQAAAQRTVTKQKKSQEQINDEIRTAELNTADATQAVIDAKEAETDLVVDLGIQERENQEALNGLRLDEEASTRRRFEQQQALNVLREGETTHSKALKAIDEEIIGVQDQIVTNAIDIRDREREVETSRATQRDYAITIRDAQIAVRDATDKIREHSNDIRDAQKQIAEDSIAYREAVATAKNDTLATNNLLIERLGINSKLLAQNPDLLKDTVNKLLENITGPRFLERRELKRGPLTDVLINHPDRLIDFLRNNGFGFANGGVITKHMIANIGEGGKAEAVLPLTKPARAMTVLAQSIPLMHTALQKRIAPVFAPSPVIPSISASSSPGLDLPAVNRSGSSTKTVPFVSKNDGPATYGQIEELISVMRENGGGTTVQANVTVEDPHNEDVLVRRISRKLERTIDERLNKRR